MLIIAYVEKKGSWDVLLLGWEGVGFVLSVLTDSSSFLDEMSVSFTIIVVICPTMYVF